MHFEGDLLVCPVKTSVEVVELVREGAIAGWGHSTGWFEVCDGLYALPHAPGVRGVEVLYDPLFVYVFSLGDSPPQIGPWLSLGVRGEQEQR